MKVVFDCILLMLVILSTRQGCLTWQCSYRIFWDTVHSPRTFLRATSCCVTQQIYTWSL